MFADNADYEATVRYVQGVVPRDGCIFVGALRHDRIFVNDILFYFLAERDSATKYYELSPRLVTTAPIQAAIVRDIERRGVEYVVLYTVELVEGGRDRGPAGSARELDEYLRSTFSPVQTFGHYSVWRRHTPTGVPSTPCRWREEATGLAS